MGTVQVGLKYGINNLVGKPTIGAAVELLEKAWEKGIRTLDSAEGYGDAHQVIGHFHKNHSERFTVNTKFEVAAGHGILKQLENSFLELGVDSVNTYFFHSFTDYISNPDKIAELQRLKSLGNIQNLGVSVYENGQLSIALADSAIDVIQLPFNLLDNIKQRGKLLKKAKANNKIIQARSVFLQGLFFKTPDLLPQKMAPLSCYLNQMRDIAARDNISIDQLALSYVMSQEDIDEIVIGVDTAHQLERNIEILGIHLDEQTKKDLDAIDVRETELLFPYNW